MSNHQYPDGTNELSFWYMPFPKCPYCGYEHRDEIYDNWPSDLELDGDRTEYTCSYCEKVFTLRLHLEHEFTSTPTENNDATDSD